MLDDNGNYIDIKGVHKYYGKNHVLDDISIQIKPGDIYGILGPSGCGKTTIVKIIAGILDSNEGETFVLNKKMPDLKVMANIGYMAQSDALYELLTAEENLLFFGSIYGMSKKKIRQRTVELMKLLNLAFEGNKKVASYSGGMKRRLSLAIALLNSPKILILDEPTVGIDPLLRRSIWEEFRKIASDNTAILLTTHVMDEATKCDKLAMIRDGKIIATGTPDEIISQSGTSSIEEAFIHFSFGGSNNED
ncbi:MAG: ABC transporter ATP-binding protein [Proteocatella sp.]